MSFIYLILIGLVGLAVHWLKKWARGQTKSGFLVYMRAHKKHSIASVCTVIGSVAAYAALGDIALSIQSAGQALTIGYMVDSAVNKKPEDK